MQTWEEKIIEREKALADGIAIGEENTRFSALRNLMANLNLPAEKALDALAVPIEDRDKYLKQLK